MKALNIFITIATGSYYSDQPTDSLWTNERFVEEVRASNE
jgi:hypothetical protein